MVLFLGILGKATSDTKKSFDVIFCLQTTIDAVEFKSHKSKTKKLHICPYLADVTWVKNLCVEKMEGANCEKKDKTDECQRVKSQETPDCFHNFDKERIGTDRR